MHLAFSRTRRRSRAPDNSTAEAVECFALPRTLRCTVSGAAAVYFSLAWSLSRGALSRSCAPEVIPNPTKGSQRAATAQLVPPHLRWPPE